MLIPQKFGIGGTKIGGREERNFDSKFSTSFHITMRLVVSINIMQTRDSFLKKNICVCVYTSPKSSINPLKNK